VGGGGATCNACMGSVISKNKRGENEKKNQTSHACVGSVVPNTNTGIILHYICRPEHFEAADK